MYAGLEKSLVLSGKHCSVRELLCCTWMSGVNKTVFPAVLEAVLGAFCSREPKCRVKV